MYGVDTNTTRGVRHLFRSFIIFLIVSLFGIAIAYVTLELAPYLEDLTDPNVDPDPELVSRVMVLVPLACGFSIVALVGIVLLILGLWAMYRGKEEYGNEHKKNVDRAVLLFVAAAVLVILNVSIEFGIGLVAGAGSGGTTGSNTTLSVVAGVLDVIYSIAVAFLIFYLIKAFIPSEKSNLAILAIGLYSAAPIASLVLSMIYPVPANIAGLAFDPMWLVPAIASGILSAIAMIMYVVLYHGVYRRLRSKEIRPVWEQQIPGFAQQQETRWQPPPSG